MTFEEFNKIKLNEECGELIQINSKTNIYGIDSINPDTGISNYDALSKEMHDVIASIKIIAKLYGIDISETKINSRIDKLQLVYNTTVKE